MRLIYQAPTVIDNGIAVYRTLGGGSGSLENPPQLGIGSRQDSNTGNETKADSSSENTLGESEVSDCTSVRYPS